MAMVDFGKDVTIIPAVNEMTDTVVLWGLGKTPMLESVSSETEQSVHRLNPWVVGLWMKNEGIRSKQWDCRYSFT
jgi:hypothetical protein